MAKLALILHRRRALVLALSVVAAIVGAKFGHLHPGGKPGFGLWDGPL